MVQHMPDPPRTLTEITAERLRQCICEGRWKKEIPGLPTLASEFGVAEGTMRRAIRILEQEELITYVGSGKRRELTEKATKSESMKKLRFGILLRDRIDHEDAGFRSILLTLRADLESKGHQWVQLAKTQADLKYDTTRIMRMVSQTSADLWIVIAGERPLMECFSAQFSHTCSIGGSGYWLPGVRQIGSNSRPAYASLIQRLAPLGHKRIVFFLPHFIRKSKSQFTVSFIRDQLLKIGIEASAYHMPDWDETPEGLQQQLATLFRVTPPTAIFATSPVWISGILSFISRAKLRIPEDVSVICGNFSGSFLWHQPSIAHFHHDDRGLLRRILRWADHASRGRIDQKAEELPVRLIECRSIGPVSNS